MPRVSDVDDDTEESANGRTLTMTIPHVIIRTSRRRDIDSLSISP